MVTRGYGYTDRGSLRDRNEDTYLIDDEVGAYIVCDGMGGRADGDVASGVAARTVAKHLREHAAFFSAFSSDESSRAKLANVVDEALQAASRKLHARAQGQRRKVGMGTTMTLLLTLPGHALMAHVGDSRLYMCRGKKVYQLSRDHTYVQELVDRGALTEEEAKNSPISHTITRALGLQPSVHVDQLLFETAPEDVFLLCTDGLTHHVKAPDELIDIMSETPCATLPDRLGEIANQRGGSDNITVVVVTVSADDTDDTEAEKRKVQFEERLRMLQFIDLFDGLTMRELVRVLSCMRVERIAGGESIVVRAEPGDKMFIVEKGTVEVSIDDRKIASFGEGAHFGEIALLANTPRTATVHAVEPSRLLVLARPEFDELLRTTPVVANKLLFNLAKSLAERLTATSEKAYATTD